MRRNILYLIGLFVFAVIVSIVTSNVIESNTPDFILKKYDQLKNDNVLMDSIGGFKSFEYSFNKNQYDAGKELEYSIIIFGEEKDLRFEGLQSKDQNGKWVLTRGKMSVE